MAEDKTPVNNDPAIPLAKKPQKKAAQPYFTTKQGQATLTGVSLSELALRIKATDPNKSFSQARNEAKQLQQAQAALSTGGGGTLANAKLGLLRKTLGQNLGTKVSRALTSSKTQDKAAQTLINFDGGKTERVHNTESEATIKALQDQVEKLTKAVKTNTAIRVTSEQKPVKVEKKVKEDLSDAVSALKALGFDMKEIKDRLSSLPKGLSTEDQIKHALKPTTERVKPADIKTVVEQTIKTELKQTGVDARTGKPRARVVEASETAPVAATPQAPPEPEKPSMLNDRIQELFKTNQPDQSGVQAKPAIRTPIKQDEIVTKEKEDKSDTDKKDDKKKQDEKQSAVMKKLESIQRGLKDLHSESFIGLLVLAVGALVARYIKPVIEGLLWVKQKLQPIFDMFSDFYNKWLSSDANKRDDSRNKKYADLVHEAMQLSKEGKKEEAHKLAVQADNLRNWEAEDIDANERTLKAGGATTLEQAIRMGKKSFTNQESGQSTTHTLTAEDYKNSGVDVPADLKAKSQERPKLEPVKPASSAARKRADDLDKATQEKADTSMKPTASTIVIPMPMKETRIPVPVNSGGGDSALAILAARNDDPTSQNYIGSLFDHPATYGPLGRV
jgi:hypothetical protein